MEKLGSHLRKTFLAGVFAAVPVVVTVWLIVYVDQNTRFISERLFGRGIPVVGILIALVLIYLGGLVATSLLGRWFVGRVDYLLSRVPGLKELYAAWKQIALTPGGGEGMFAKVVLVGEQGAAMRQLGFTSGQPMDGQADVLCVFIPNAPNPIQGRLFFVNRSLVQFTAMTSEEAFKLILSTGNYVPAELSAACGVPPVKAGTALG